MEYIKDIEAFESKEVCLKGWVANKRESKGLVFLLLRDGSGFIQCVIDAQNFDAEKFETAKKLSLECSIKIIGKVLKDEKQVGGYEISATDLEVYHFNEEEYPISKKEHGVEFLMDKRHLWLRSQKQWAILKVRNQVIFSIHQFFQRNDFTLFDSPLFTGNAAEGSTDLFETDFYGKPAYLAQTGQLYAEAGAMALGKVYTFGPTFRAEKSKTRRHLSEFWMIEPEMAFYDLDMNMDLIEKFIQEIITEVVGKCEKELKILGRDVSVFDEIKKPFPRIKYIEAVEYIRGEKDVNGKNSIKLLETELKEKQQQIEANNSEIKEREVVINDTNSKKGVRNFNRNKVDILKNANKDLLEYIENIPQWIESAKNFKQGEDLGGSDETILTKLFSSPVMVYNWPTKIKAFYMKRVEDDENFVKGVDVLAPEGYGEIVGGSERETNLKFLLERIKEEELDEKDFEWYNDLRKYGSVPHSGFGLGLERLICWICNLKHIRESIPFPRMYGRLFP